VTIAVHANRACDPALAFARELETAIRDLRAADNPFGRLLAVRNGAKALAMSERAADDAMDRLRGIAVGLHGLDPPDVAAAIDHGCEMARVARQLPPMMRSGGGGTPGTTVESVLYALRRGLSCLDDPGNRERLRRCDAAAMREICHRLLNFSSGSAGRHPDWTGAEVAKLFALWEIVGGRT
jgi:hypothetical protein